MDATKQQKQLIHVNAPTRDIKEEFVQWATGDNDKISCNDLDFDQANAVLEKLGIRPFAPSLGRPVSNWGKFDKNDQQHRYILSLLRQMGWTKASERYGTIADMERLSNFLKSNKSPVPKPLQKMTAAETTKLINALESMLGKKWEKQ